MTRETDYFKSFCKISKAFGTAATREEFLTIIVNNAIASMEGKAACLFLDDDGHGLKMVASHGLSEDFLERGRTTTTETAQRALQGETIIISDSTTDNSITFKAAMKTEGIVSMIVTPIQVREKVIGVLRLYSDVERQFPDDVIMMVKALAHQGGLAIQNASMYLQLEKDKKSLEEDIWSHRSWF